MFYRLLGVNMRTYEVLVVEFEEHPGSPMRFLMLNASTQGNRIEELKRDEVKAAFANGFTTVWTFLGNEGTPQEHVLFQGLKKFQQENLGPLKAEVMQQLLRVA